jgi:hypothetical protein
MQQTQARAIIGIAPGFFQPRKVQPHLLPAALELAALRGVDFANDIAPVRHLRAIESLVVCMIGNNDELTV